jgi:hypothetical protein
MHHFALVGMVLLGAACSREVDPRDLRPSVELVDRIEAQLASRPCFAPLNQWERRFRYGMGGDYRSADRGIERDRITFSFAQAGIFEFRSRRLVLSANDEDQGPGTDSRDYKFAFGDYDIPSGRLTVHGCGSNSDRLPERRTR